MTLNICLMWVQNSHCLLGLKAYLACNLISLTELEPCLIIDIGRFLLCQSVRNWRRLGHDFDPGHVSLATAGSICTSGYGSGWYMAEEYNSNNSGTQQIKSGNFLKFLQKTKGWRLVCDLYEACPCRSRASRLHNLKTICRKSSREAGAKAVACVGKMARVRIPPPRGFAATKTHGGCTLARPCHQKRTRFLGNSLVIL